MFIDQVTGHREAVGENAGRKVPIVRSDLSGASPESGETLEHSGVFVGPSFRAGVREKTGSKTASKCGIGRWRPSDYLPSTRQRTKTDLFDTGPGPASLGSHKARPRPVPCCIVRFGMGRFVLYISHNRDPVVPSPQVWTGPDHGTPTMSQCRRHHLHPGV